MILLRASFATVFFLGISSGATAGEMHYLLMFGSQRVPNTPNYTHTWATFVKATWPGDEPCPVNPTLESHTISWLPCNGIVRIRALFPEPGRNFGFEETLNWCVKNEMRISVWGAYRIERELYCRALKQIELLNSGQVRYKAVDSGRSTDRVSNCTHAVSSLTQGNRLRVASPGWGESASYFTLQELKPWICDVGCSHAWVGSALGLDAWPIIYRDYRNPRSNAVIGWLYRALGGESELQATYGPPAR